MKENRVIKLPVFRTMFNPVARKAWKCNLCNQKVDVGDRYVHYIDRRPHEIINYRFHTNCFQIVEVYCAVNSKTSFTPTKVRNWMKKTYCEQCEEKCETHPCEQLKSVISTILKNI